MRIESSWAKTKYASCSSLIQASSRTQVADGKFDVTLPLDKAPFKLIFCLIIRVNLLRALKLRISAFTRDDFVQQSQLTMQGSCDSPAQTFGEFSTLYQETCWSKSLCPLQLYYKSPNGPASPGFRHCSSSIESCKLSFWPDQHVSW